MWIHRVASGLLGLSWKERLALAEAFGALAGAQVALRWLPFKRIVGSFGGRMEESSTSQIAANQAAGRRVGWAVRTAGRHMPWAGRCLPQAVAAKWMMRRRRLASTLYLGVAVEEDGELEAHAWVRSGEQLLTGATTLNRFTVLSTFADGA